MRGAVAAMLVCAACIPPATAPLSASCEGTQGGTAGAETQLRFLEATDSQIVITFGPSAESNAFGVPAFSLEPLEGTSAPRAYRLRVAGTSSRNPDGTASYDGPRSVEPGSRTVRALRFIDESRRTMTFTVLLEKAACPFVAARTYVYGKSPRAQIALTFDNAGSLTLETQSDDLGGAEIGTAVQASGMGYAPGSTVTLWLGDRRLQQTVAGPDGAFDTGLFVPQREPGLYTVTADDGHGRIGRTPLRVMVRRATH